MLQRTLINFNYCSAKVGIKSCRFTVCYRMCFVCACMNVTSYPAGIGLRE